MQNLSFSNFTYCVAADTKSTIAPCCVTVKRNTFHLDINRYIN